MMMESCNFTTMLFMGGSHFLEFLAVVVLIIFLGAMLFRSRADQPASHG